MVCWASYKKIAHKLNLIPNLKLELIALQHYDEKMAEMKIKKKQQINNDRKMSIQPNQTATLDKCRGITCITGHTAALTQCMHSDSSQKLYIQDGNQRQLA